MGVIELGKAMSDYGIALVVTAVFLVLIFWLVKRLINEQSNTNKDILEMFKVELKLLHKDELRNARLNRKSIDMLGTLTEYLNRHFNGCNNKVNFKKKIKKEGQEKC